MSVVKKEAEKVNENNFNQKMLKISCDLGIDDYGCTVGYRVDIDGNIKIEKIKYFKQKGVKKVKPYFECKVVKVKKNKYKINRSLYCPYCNNKLEREKPLGNWVNGENLDKIKFPCFGWYLSGIGKRYCELDFINYEKGFYRVKELKQHKKKDYSCAEFWNTDLKRLIDMLNFHILKGKIILFEEE